MPFTFTAAHSSRITKSKPRKPVFNRSIPGGFTRRKTAKVEPAADDDPEDDLFEDRLDDLGLVTTLETDLSLRDVVPTMTYICAHMFDEVPAQRSGMNSTRTAEVLNFRRSLPKIVLNAHVHALVKSPTLVEREIGQLIAGGLLRRITVPGRGLGASSISDGLVLVKDWVAKVQESQDLPEDLKKKYIAHIESKDTSTASLISDISEDEITLLMRTGFLTSSTVNMRHSSNALSRPRDAMTGTLTSIENISKAASGSLNAVGGGDAVLNSGGGGSAGLQNGRRPGIKSPGSFPSTAGVEMKLSLPGTGAYLKLVGSARSHLLSLLSRSKYKEGPLYLLRERWDGNTATNKGYGRSRDPFSQVLPGKTRKWKEFYGLKFDWVLAECLGGGLVEVFETGSVGLGVRAIA